MSMHEKGVELQLQQQDKQKQIAIGQSVRSLQSRQALSMDKRNYQLRNVKEAQVYLKKGGRFDPLYSPRKEALNLQKLQQLMPAKLQPLILNNLQDDRRSLLPKMAGQNFNLELSQANR